MERIEDALDGFEHDDWEGITVLGILAKDMADWLADRLEIAEQIRELAMSRILRQLACPRSRQERLIFRDDSGRPSAAVFFRWVMKALADAAEGG